MKEIVKKYELTSKDINEGIDQLCQGGLGKITNVSCMLAFAEILTELEYTAKRMEKEVEEERKPGDYTGVHNPGFQIGE